MKNLEAVIVLTTCGSREEAERIAHALVERRLAACVQVSSPITSTYRWEGKIETAEEFGLSIKTTADRLAKITELLGELHSYEVPQVLALPVDGGGNAYLRWLRGEVHPE